MSESKECCCLVEHEGSIYMVNITEWILKKVCLSGHHCSPSSLVSREYILFNSLIYIEEQLVCVDEKWKKPTVLLIFAGAGK